MTIAIAANLRNAPGVMDLAVDEVDTAFTA
jgi:hypothetical protein